MSSFVLVHGSWFGSWCWDKVTPLLRRQGHRVETPDLPGYGPDKTPYPEITLQSYVDRIGQALDKCAEPAILVGHSRGGIVITQTAEQWPERVHALVYLCAFLTQDGESLLQLAQQDQETKLFPHLTFAEDQGYVAFNGSPEALKEVFCADGSDEEAARSYRLLVPDALAPVMTPLHTTNERFGRVPRTYIECLQDQAIGPSLQQQMYGATPCGKVISMNTSHSPFFAAPEELATHLHSIALATAAAGAQ